MQVVILCGGGGTRLKEETEFKPKPMIHIGGKPMLWHIMKLYAHYGFDNFVLALGYKQEIIKEYFYHFDVINNDVAKDRRNNFHLLSAPESRDRWVITMSDTGENTLKGGRLKRIEKYVAGDTFMMTYGDGVGDIDIRELLAFHKSHGKMVTVTGVHPAPRFGEISHEDGKVLTYAEKPFNDNLINGGFYVFNREIFAYLTPDEWCDLEVGPLELIAAKGEMMVYRHKGYWGCMDTIHNMNELNKLWETGQAKWRVWE